MRVSHECSLGARSHRWEDAMHGGTRCVSTHKALYENSGQCCCHIGCINVCCATRTRMDNTQTHETACVSAPCPHAGTGTVAAPGRTWPGAPAGAQGTFRAARAPQPRAWDWRAPYRSSSRAPQIRAAQPCVLHPLGPCLRVPWLAAAWATRVWADCCPVTGTRTALRSRDHLCAQDFKTY